MSPRVTTAHEQGQRRRILHAAAICFARAGVHRTTIQDICDEAGLSKGGVYTYFKSKDEILAAVVGHSVAHSLERAKAAAATATTPLEKIDRIATQFTADLAAKQASPGFSPRLLLEVWAQASKDDRLSALCARGYDEWRRFIAALLREAQTVGQLRPDVDTDALAAIVVSTFDGLSLQEALSGVPIDWPRIVQTLRLAMGEGTFTAHTREGVR
ncbi:MAG: TetR/AcrR family transcriptional regulator [Armatimonadota bacterium]|nr:TetR/AcrR family transcriptional regulator [Armatimonadota bacterium]MDR7452169.1 TetR/AcrR family transcriptional regulator [Armatimonadota bacterium]MDR7468064.1 TetR/AcrR family transcriptional regulator [Armatimonadota bacterium]MDR7494895.1 TetR/AcrR family transcriptional regulator [Armatimonadota bacterium]MDR7500292.1 TetR/AcrR family transcriptional regulator [Armatimonadota bacterium]